MNNLIKLINCYDSDPDKHIISIETEYHDQFFKYNENTLFYIFNNMDISENVIWFISKNLSYRKNRISLLLNFLKIFFEKNKFFHPSIFLYLSNAAINDIEIEDKKSFFSTLLCKKYMLDNILSCKYFPNELYEIAFWKMLNNIKGFLKYNIDVDIDKKLSSLLFKDVEKEQDMLFFEKSIDNKKKITLINPSGKTLANLIEYIKEDEISEINIYIEKNKTNEKVNMLINHLKNNLNNIIINVLNNNSSVKNILL